MREMLWLSWVHEPRWKNNDGIVCALMMTGMPWSHVLNLQSGLATKKKFSIQRLPMVVSLEVGLQTSMALPSFTSPYSVCQSISADESTRWLEWLDQESPPWVGIVPCSRESFMLWLSILSLLLELCLLLSMDGAAASLMTRPLLRRRQ